MAKPSTSVVAAAAVGAVIRAYLGITFVLLLLLTSFSGLPRRSQFTDLSLSPSLVVATEAHGLQSHEERCHDTAARPDGRDNYPLSSDGYIDYMYLFYCILGGDHRPLLGYALLVAWLAVIFYLLADTAVTYFCANLEGLMCLVGLPPAIAGAMLLSLGNGTPDVLSAIASFTTPWEGGTTTAVGLSSVLDGTMFVSSTMLRVIVVCLGSQGIAVHHASFFWDATFLLLALVAVAVVVTVVKVTVWATTEFASLYVIYVLVVVFTLDRWSRRDDTLTEDDHTSPAATTTAFSELHNITETKFYTNQEDALLNKS